MSQKNNNNIDCGVPRPYSNKKLPTPKYVIAEFVKPLPIWSFLLVSSLLLLVLSVVLINYTSELYNSSILMIGIAIILGSIILSKLSVKKKNINNVPSINDVSNTIEYVRAASRLTILTLISGIITTIFIIISHTSDIFYFIDDSTRIAILILMFFAYIGSYLMVKSLCSYSSIYKNTSLSLPVDVSSLPEIVTVIGFITPPLLVIFTGLIYNGPPIVDTPFYISAIDTFVILCAIQIAYVALVSRI